MRKTFGILLLLWITALAAGHASAARVGLVAVFPNGTIYQRCLSVEAGASGYDILEQSGLSITWSPSIRFGHQLCAINGLGCPESNCNCNRKSTYWNFFLKRPGYADWIYPDSIESRYDAGSTCQEHYCGRDGDIIGLKYGYYQDTPYPYRFQDICPADTGKDIQVRKDAPPKVVGRVVSIDPEKTFSFILLGGFFLIALLLGTVRYVRRRR